MEMQRSKDALKVSDFGGNLNEAVASQEQISQYYMSVGDSMMSLSAQAVGTAVDVESENQRKKGEREGYEKASKGGGLDLTPGIFKWDREYNRAATSAFEATIASNAAGYMQNIAKLSNGNPSLYESAARKAKEEALKEVTDEDQRTFIEASYNSAYVKNLKTVATDGLRNTKKRALDSWKNSRDRFSDDVATLYDEYYNVQTKIRTGQYRSKEEKTEFEKKGAETLEQITNTVNTRLNSAAGGVNIGAYTEAEIKATVREDYVKGIINSRKAYMSKLSDTASKDQYFEILEYLHNPDPTLTDRENEQVLKALAQHVADLNARDAVQTAREKREKEVASEESRIDIKTDIITYRNPVDPTKQVNDEGVIDAISSKIWNAYASDLISETERDAYLDELRNGSMVKRDNMNTYAEIQNNIEDYSVGYIAQRNDLKDATKAQLIRERTQWEERGEKWMTEPDYREGKNIIRMAFGFPEASFLPEVLTGEKKQRYLEMTAVMKEFRSAAEVEIKKGNRYGAQKIAEELIQRQKKDARSALYYQDEDRAVLTRQKAAEAARERGVEIQTILDEQFKRFPNTTYDKGIEGASETGNAKNDALSEAMANYRKNVGEEDE